MFDVCCRRKAAECAGQFELRFGAKVPLLSCFEFEDVFDSGGRREAAEVLMDFAMGLR